MKDFEKKNLAASVVTTFVELDKQTPSLVVPLGDLLVAAAILEAAVMISDTLYERET